MKRLLFLSLLISLSGCSSCFTTDTTFIPCDGSVCDTPSAEPTTTAKPPPSVPDQVISESDWEISLPANWVKLEPPTEMSEIKLFYGNQETKTIVVLVKESFTGAADDYVLATIRGVRESGATVNSAAQVELNGIKFVMVDSSRDNLRMWMWATAQNGYGYALSCGGPDTNDSHKDMCSKIANTFKLK